jgi:hypothetical protein
VTRSPGAGPPLRARISPELTAGVLVLFLTVPVSLLLVVRASASSQPSAPTPSPSIVAPSLVPTASIRPSPTPRPTTPPNIGTIQNVLLIDERLSQARSSLLEILADKPVDVGTLAEELRDINVTINAGQGYASALTATPQTERAGSQLLEVYEAVHEVSVATLASSLRDTRAYIDGARQIVSELSALKAPDRVLQGLAGG